MGWGGVEYMIISPLFFSLDARARLICFGGRFFGGGGNWHIVYLFLGNISCVVVGEGAQGRVERRMVWFGGFGGFF